MAKTIAKTTYKNGTTAAIIASVGGYDNLKKFADARDELRRLHGLKPLGYCFDYDKAHICMLKKGRVYEKI